MPTEARVTGFRQGPAERPSPRWSGTWQRRKLRPEWPHPQRPQPPLLTHSLLRSAPRLEETLLLVLGPSRRQSRPLSGEVEPSRHRNCTASRDPHSDFKGNRSNDPDTLLTLKLSSLGE